MEDIRLERYVTLKSREHFPHWSSFLVQGLTRQDGGPIFETNAMNPSSLANIITSIERRNSSIVVL